MNSRTWLWFALPFMLLLAGCSGGGGGTGLQSSLPLALQAYLKASNTNISDHFGRRVAIDGETLVVGVPDEASNATGIGGNQADTSAPGAGAVYVFTRSAGVWTQQAYIKASNTGASDAFGTSVAISGNTLVVGAPGEVSNATGIGSNQADTSAPGAGAVYVFTRSAGTWTQQAYIKASNTETGDAFGTNVAISGNTLVVGAPNEDSGLIGATAGSPNEAATTNAASTSGAVYVFTRSGTTWTQQAYIKASNTETGDAFGTNVAISGNTLVVGAPNEDSGLTGVTAGSPNEAATANAASTSGAVYVFTRSGTTWSQQAYVKASNTGANDAFGAGVGIDSDTLVVGATGEDGSLTGVITSPPDDTATGNSASDSGAVYVFTRAGTTWSQQAYVKASNTEAGDAFGTSVAISGNTLVIGAPGEDSAITTVIQGLPNEISTGSGAINAGAAYLFVNAGVWSQQAYVKSSNTDASDAFGTSVAISGDTLVVSATGEDSSATGIGGDQTDSSAADSGAAYVFR